MNAIMCLRTARLAATLGLVSLAVSGAGAQMFGVPEAIAFPHATP